MSRREHGSVAVELVLLAPVLFALIGFIVMVGRIGEVRQTVVNAAQQAARAATLVGDPVEAQAAATRAAHANLSTQDATCSSVAVEVDLSRFARGGDVGVEVACVVDLSDVTFAGLPGSRTVSASAVEVIDVWRGGS